MITLYRESVIETETIASRHNVLVYDKSHDRALAGISSRSRRDTRYSDPIRDRLLPRQWRRTPAVADAATGKQRQDQQKQYRDAHPLLRRASTYCIPANHNSR